MVLKWRHEISTAPDMAAAFADRARADSHCSSGSRGGDLGTFGRGKMQRPFEEASFALKVCVRKSV
jgi:parvulin-like peptidyl-prolyl isomerase